MAAIGPRNLGHKKPEVISAHRAKGFLYAQDYPILPAHISGSTAKGSPRSHFRKPRGMPSLTHSENHNLRQSETALHLDCLRPLLCGNCIQLRSVHHQFPASSEAATQPDHHDFGRHVIRRKHGQVCDGSTRGPGETPQRRCCFRKRLPRTRLYRNLSGPPNSLWSTP